MTHVWGERVLLHGGQVLVALTMGLFVFSYAWIHGGAPADGLRPGAPFDVSGVIATYETDALVISTSDGTRRTVRVRPSTTVLEIDAPAAVSDLRPGRAVAIQCAPRLPGGALTARAIVVWGAG